MSTSTSERRTVSIRGVDSELYRRLVAISKEAGKTVGEVFNEAAALYVALSRRFSGSLERMVEAIGELKQSFREGFESAGIRIADIRELTISRSDLEAFGKPVILHRIGRLTLDDTVDNECFKEYIGEIRGCDEVVIHPGLSKLLVLSRCREVKSVKVGS